MLALDPKSARFLAANFVPVLHQPLGGGSQRRLVSNHDSCSLHLGAGLFRITPIREEHTAGFRYRENPGCPRKPTKVSDVREMSDEQRIAGAAVDDSLQPLQPALVIHAGSVTSQSQQHAYTTS